ncbi:MAG TPA: 3-phosphoshikimate 1-carboxyvinyltransferase [Candidatus Kapabacteria bacterium]|nr:3-phosphoshikimate 1-carboxyvinyltransferase [Candidatus Kapabacteria bacterium]
MIVEIAPFEAGNGEREISPLVMPPDKSVLHRLLIIGSLTTTSFTIPITDPHMMSHDVIATILALESVGVPVELFNDHIELQGVGLGGFKASNHIINCANSGTTARLMMGILAGQPFSSVLSGDDSLSRRPMKRLSNILIEKMGADIHTSPEGTLPAMIQGKPLHGATVDLVVASAQMKTAILLAGVFADGETRVKEPTQSRDHTELMLEAFGYGVTFDEEGYIGLEGKRPFVLEDELVFDIPGDISSAAFVAVAAVLLKLDVAIEGVLLNPTRTRFLDLLAVMGVEIESENVTEVWGEDRGTLKIFGSRIEKLSPLHVTAEDASLLIDELPILGLLACFADGESTFEGVSELRVKESDRIHHLIEQLHEFGVAASERPDGFSIIGQPERRFTAAQVRHAEDHRLAMTFAVAALFNETVLRIEDAEVVKVSYPQFFEHLATLAGEHRIRIKNDHALN